MWLFQLIPAGGVQGGAVDNKTITADAGSYAFTGSTAAVELGREVAADAGSYLFGGTDAALEVGREVVAAAETYAVSGQDAALERGYEVAADAGSYTVSGTAATFVRSYVVTVEAGSYVIGGQDAGLVATGGAPVLVADGGSYTISGTDAAPRITSRLLVAANGNYAINGTDAALTTGAAGEEEEAPRRGGIDLTPVRQRRKYRYVTAQRLQELLDEAEARAESAPAPTRKRVKRLNREIVSTIEAEGLLGPAKPAVARFVQAEVRQAYQPAMEWAALVEAVQNITRRAAEEAARLEAEHEDEEEAIIMLLVA